MSLSDDKSGITMAAFENELLHEPSATAALGICESLLLALIDLKLISEKVAHDLLSDVITTHNQSSRTVRSTGEASSGGRNRSAITDR